MLYCMKKSSIPPSGVIVKLPSAPTPTPGTPAIVSVPLQTIYLMLDESSLALKWWWYY